MSHRTFNDPCQNGNHGTSDVARQALLDNRCEHKPKRHRTLARRKRLSKAKRQRVKHHLEMQAATRRKFLIQVRRYWANEGDHPLAIAQS
jgi:hypothetical protein